MNILYKHAGVMTESFDFSDTDSVDNNAVDAAVPQTVDTQEVSMTFKSDNHIDPLQYATVKNISAVISSQENGYGHRNPLFSTFNGDTPKPNMINGLQASDI